jgi:hypothetical protein
VLAYGDVCPKARGIIHLGATSCYVTDNADILMLRDALALIRQKVVEVLRRLRAFAWKYRALPTLGYTHLQPAQLTTVGKRACLWMQDLELDLHDYQWVAIHTKFKPDNGQTKMHFCPVDCQVGLDVITISGYRGLRKADVSQTGIHFYKASYCTDTLHENVSGYVIPLAVYGIRGIGDTNERGEEE